MCVHPNAELRVAGCQQQGAGALRGRVPLLKVIEAPVDDDGDEDDHILPLRFYLPLKAHKQTTF